MITGVQSEFQLFVGVIQYFYYSLQIFNAAIEGYAFPCGVYVSEGICCAIEVGVEWGEVAGFWVGSEEYAEGDVHI